MYVDLLTLYLLAIGTLLASSGMMLWEHRTNPERSKELRILAAGFATLAAGCAAILLRGYMPVATGAAISNLIILGGYLLLLNGVASLRNQKYRASSIGLLVVMALIWAAAGTSWLNIVWSYISSIPIALVSGMTAWEILRCDAMKSLPSRRIVAMVTSIHAVLYGARAFILPWLVIANGMAVQSVAGKITIYEGVLYSVILPMTLLKLIREEAHSRVLRDSQTDYLTGLGSRRWFFQEGSRIIHGAERHGPFSILAFDLDHFKTINDLYGHQTGDEVLKSFADTARSVIGPDGILARIGGEEFAALLSGPDARRAQALGEEIATLFSATVANRVETVGVEATVSIGMAEFENEVPSLDDGLAAADRALYLAKSLGGNRLESAEVVMLPTPDRLAAEKAAGMRRSSRSVERTRQQ